MFPEDSVQAFAEPWWIQEAQPLLRRGRLLRTYVPFPEQKPYSLTIEGRPDPKDHAKANVRIEPYRVGQVPPASVLPVAAMPLLPGQHYMVNRGKVRPVLVLSTGGADIPRALRRGMAGSQISPRLLVAPYFGAAKDGTRAGWPEPFATRIRHAEYPQYMWDTLPIGGQSILRLDHTFPIGTDAAAYETTPHCLSDDGLRIVDEWFSWLLTGVLPRNSLLGEIRSELMKLS